MTVVYIRHTNDEEDEPTYTEDPGILPDTSSQIAQLVRRLIEKYGSPDLLIVSPMNRAIQTARQIKFVLEEDRLPVKTAISPHVSRFFTRSEVKGLGPNSIHPRTVELQFPCHETKDQFHRRVDVHISDFIDRGYYLLKKPIVWCITHTLIMKRVAKQLKVPFKDHLEFLDFLPLVPGIIHPGLAPFGPKLTSARAIKPKQRHDEPSRTHKGLY